MLPQVKSVDIGGVAFGGGSPLSVIAGVCVIESLEHTLTIARRLQSICRQCGLALVFKASYDKANRTAIESYRGPGLREGLKILRRVKEETGLPLLIDFHREQDAPAVAEVADALQVPAFLCRQTDMVLAAAMTGKAVNIKKGQFLAPEDIFHIIGKVASAGNDRILITERGSTFGYHYLINDFKGVFQMREFGYPVIFDATHSVQSPGGREGYSGGRREFVPPLARAAAGAGCDGLFLEVHDQPKRALSDAPSVLSVDELDGLLLAVKEIDRVARVNFNTS